MNRLLGATSTILPTTERPGTQARAFPIPYRARRWFWPITTCTPPGSFLLGGAMRRDEVGGVRSADGGQTWTPITMPRNLRRRFGVTQPTTTCLFPSNMADWLSPDQSQTWTGSSGGLRQGGADIMALRLQRHGLRRLFLGVLFKSTDRGVHWNVLAPGLGVCDAGQADCRPPCRCRTGVRGHRAGRPVPQHGRRRHLGEIAGRPCRADYPSAQCT